MVLTVIRPVTVTAMIVSAPRAFADELAEGLDEARVNVVRAEHAASACERIAVAMPQVIVVLERLRDDERDALVDCATAVGGLVMYFDRDVETETLGELVTRVSQVALERKRLRDGASSTAAATNAVTAPPPGGNDDDIDSNW